MVFCSRKVDEDEKHLVGGGAARRQVGVDKRKRFAARGTKAAMVEFMELYNTTRRRNTTLTKSLLQTAQTERLG